ALQKEAPVVKIIVVGNSNVGKTSLCSLLRSYYQQVGDDTTPSKRTESDMAWDQKIRRVLLTIAKRIPTESVALTPLNVTYGEKQQQLRLEILDTAGEEKFHSMTIGYYRNIQCVILVFSYNDLLSVQSLESIWIEQIRRGLQLQDDELVSSRVAI